MVQKLSTPKLDNFRGSVAITELEISVRYPVARSSAQRSYPGRQSGLVPLVVISNPELRSAEMALHETINGRLAKRLVNLTSPRVLTEEVQSVTQTEGKSNDPARNGKF